MGQIMKLYTALFLMLIMAVSAMGIVTAQVRLIQVQNLHKSIVAEVKGSKCDRTVIESCFDRAQKTECSLIITFNEKKGKIEIDYFSRDDLERLISLLAPDGEM